MFENIKRIAAADRLELIKRNIKKISPKQRVFDHACEIADIVISKEEKYAKYSDQELKNLSYRMMDELKDKPENVDNYLIDGLAIAREMIYRAHGLKAFRTQLIGAIVVHFGDLAELATGEGKTLVLLLVSYVNSLTRKGVHIVTVNEYLVERDAEFSRTALSRLGVTVGFINSSMKPDYKREMYNCDITYVSNSELGFDYLRDNMVGNYAEKMQRPLNFAIVDEADSVLIDEARTPLIIAGTPQDDVSQYQEVDDFVKTLHPSEYIIDLESQAINLNDKGIKAAEEFFKIKNLYDIENSEIVHKIMNSLRAHHMMEIGREYIVRRNEQKGIMEIALVDSFTGRIMDGRMYSAGLHQAIQAKEHVKIEPENLTVAMITYQSFFRLYKKLSGVSGTALTEKNEMLNIYNMTVVNIPTNKPKQRKDQPDYIFATKQLKWKYVIAEIKKRHATGQPILVGTVSVDDSELIHNLLDKIGIKHQVLNAKNHAREAEIVALAGQKGAVTIATNMAGRGTDIKLGEGVHELGGLYVLGTERNESRRIDNQLRGRSGRQGDPGESRFFISLQDLLFKRFATDWFDKAQYKLGEDIIDLKFFSRLLNRTQKKVENMNFDVRKNLIDYDYVLSEQRELFYKQRDAVLLSNKIIEIVFRMIPRIVEVFMTINRHKENIDMVDINELLNDIQTKCGVRLNLDTESLRKESASVIYEATCHELRRLVYDKYKQLGKEQSNAMWRQIIIESMDKNWTKFLDRIQKLRDSVSLRSFEQKSPLNIYVEDSDYMFYNTTISIATETINGIIGVNKTDTTMGTSINGPSTPPLRFEFTPPPTNKSIEDLPISKPINQENDKINFDNSQKVKEPSMNNNNRDNVSNDELITSIVDEILNEPASSNPTPNNEILSEISDFEKNGSFTPPPKINTPPSMKQNSNPDANYEPPTVPISNQSWNQTKDTTPPPKPPINSSKSNDTDDFLDQVLSVVNNDIKPAQVDVNIKGILGDEANDSDLFESKRPSAPTSTTSSSKPTSSSPKSQFSRDDDDIVENYTPKYRSSSTSFSNKNDKPRFDDSMKMKEKEFELEKMDYIQKAKDDQIKSLQKQIDDMNANFLSQQLEQERQFQKLFSEENEELKEIHQKLLNTLDEQERYRKDKEKQLNELKEKEAYLKMEDEIRQRLENEIREEIKSEYESRQAMDNPMSTEDDYGFQDDYLNNAPINNAPNYNNPNFDDGYGYNDNYNQYPSRNDQFYDNEFRKQNNELENTLSSPRAPFNTELYGNNYPQDPRIQQQPQFQQPRQMPQNQQVNPPRPAMSRSSINQQPRPRPAMLSNSYINRVNDEGDDTGPVSLKDIKNKRRF